MENNDYQNVLKNNKKRPLIINIFKNIKQKDNKIIISAFCLTKMLGIKTYDLSKIKIEIFDKNYSIKFKLKKGIKLLKGYRFNFYKFEIPVDNVLNMDIQNKIIVCYDKNKGRIIYSVFDLLKGKNRNSKIIKVGNNSIYLRQTIKNTMYLTVRDTNYYDSIEGKIKLLIGYIISKITPNKDIILLFEKESSRYEESASVVYERLIDKDYKNVYYIINSDNVKIKDINDKYKKNIIYKNTIKHIVYFFKSKKFIGTEVIAHALQLRIANRKAIDKINDPNNMYIFLQHGVMYMISLNSELRTGFKKSQYKLHKTVVSSYEEAKHFIDLADYDINDLYICGLPKFDTAVRNKDADKIVIMPTWRRWEANQASINYEKTKYFQMIKRINRAIPKELKDKVVILPHPLMLKVIKNNKEYEKYIPEGDFTYDDILKQCSLLITDYSSISYDAFYRGSNVIFYWEEKENCLKKYGKNTKLMLNEKNAFGDVCYNTKELAKIIKDNYCTKRKSKYINRYNKIVEFSDNKNTDRLIEMLKKDKVI